MAYNSQNHLLSVLFRMLCFIECVLLLSLINWRLLPLHANAKEAVRSCPQEICPFWEFQCSGGGCINMAKFCDGIKDCLDGSDEVYVKKKEVSNSSQSSFVSCNNMENESYLTCALPSKYVCDSIPHCADGHDESKGTCTENGRNRYQKQCHAHQWCMNHRALSGCPGCDNLTSHCGDGYCTYIGENANHKCASFIFRCANGKCLSAEKFCDGNDDCGDGSDEIVNHNVSSEGVPCKNKWNYAEKKCFLPQQYVCDGINHCENRSDECDSDCPYSFICSSNQKCIPSGHKKSAPSLVGDGRDDCGDSSDEIKGAKESNFVSPKYFKCDVGSEFVVASEKFCDGVEDCPNGEDEIRFPRSGQSNVIVCSNKLGALNLSCVVPPHHRCDEIPLCRNYEDEINCGNDDHFFHCPDGNTIPKFTGVVCNFHADCCDDHDECSPEYNCSSTFSCLSDGKCLAFARFCDGVKDCEDGSDEESNPGSIITPGVSCNNVHNLHEAECILPKFYECDGIQHCHDRADECTKGCGSSFICESTKECLIREEFCDSNVNCEDGSDEKTSGSGFKCAIKRNEYHSLKTCVLPQTLLFDSVADCNDKSDTCSQKHGLCFRCLNSDLYISTNQVCDGIFDCPDLSDECLCQHELKTSTVCKNFCLQPKDHFTTCKNCGFGDVSCDQGAKCLDPKQICNDVEDCIDKSDEMACSKNKVTKTLPSSSSNFQCTLLNLEHVDFVLKCDGIPQCSDFSDECSTKQKTNTSLDEEQFECGNGTMKICKELFRDPFGLLHCNNNIMPIFPFQICNGVENCFEIASSSANNETRKPARKWEDFTVDERYCNDRFLCSDSYPIDPNVVTIHKNQICDGNTDCMKEEDESEDLCKSVTRRFYCEDHQKPASDQNDLKNDPLFVPLRKMFDGNKDCKDGSDECPSEWINDNLFSSRYRMIKDAFLSGFVWVVALVALFGNLFVIWHNLRRLCDLQRLSPMMKTNCILVLNLAIADLLMGIYLLALAIQNVNTEGEYCKLDKEWRTSISCKSLGTLAMVSSQCSVLVLLILTTYRVVTVLRPFSADLVQGRYAAIFLLGAWLLAIVISVIPHVVALEDYFVSAVWLSSNVNIFATNSPEKNSLQQFANRLKALHSINYENTSALHLSGDISWSEIRQYLFKFYPEFWPKFETYGYFDFYSSNSVCLPQIFVTKDTPSWIYALVVISFDLLSCFYIAISYVIVYQDAKRVVISDQKDDENRIMQARIARLVLTDFACWLPVCIIATLSLVGVDISPTAYAYTAIVLLPINSALNPILYSNVFNLIYKYCIKPGSNCFRKRKAKKHESFYQSRHRSVLSRTSVVMSCTYNDIPPSVEYVAMIPKNTEQGQNGSPQVYVTGKQM